MSLTLIPIPATIADQFTAVVIRYCDRIGDHSDDAKHLAHIAIIQRGCRDLSRELDEVTAPETKGKVA